MFADIQHRERYICNKIRHYPSVAMCAGRLPLAAPHQIHHGSICLRRRTGRTDPATYTTYYAPSRSLLLLTMLLLQQLHLLQGKSFQHTLYWQLLCFSLLCKTRCLHCLFQTSKTGASSHQLLHLLTVLPLLPKLQAFFYSFAAIRTWLWFSNTIQSNSQ